MIRPGPVQLMLLGFVLLVLGIVLPFLMILKVLESTLFLGFVSYLVSFGGLVIGFIGVLNYGQSRGRDRD
ncbi:MAG: hypothetical protein HZB51_09405 [Chloroflexi bacterium]|nr:hypothetical protein [Chloroflexota bacterium]